MRMRFVRFNMPGRQPLKGLGCLQHDLEFQVVAPITTLFCVSGILTCHASGWDFAVGVQVLHSAADRNPSAAAAAAAALMQSAQMLMMHGAAAQEPTAAVTVAVIGPATQS
jgi:hypothetical protein